MGVLTTAANNHLLDSLDSIITHLSMHKIYSNSGAFEATGGSPAYARQPITWASAVSGTKYNVAPIIFNLPASISNPYQWVGMWSADVGGTFYGMTPIGGGTTYPFDTSETTADTITFMDNDFGENVNVVVWADGVTSLPSPLNQGSIYYVRDSTATTIRLSLTLAGTVLSLSSAGAGRMQLIVPVQAVTQITYQIDSFTLSSVFL